MADAPTPLTDALVDKRAETTGLATAYVKMIEHARDLERRLSALQADARWIPVSERKPEPDVRVLLWDADNNGSGTEAFGYYTGNKKVEWMAECYDYDNCPGQAYGVTHWMPLPAAPARAAAPAEKKAAYGGAKK